jgi:hypothetical protein
MSDTRSNRIRRSKTLRVNNRRGLHSVLEAYDRQTASSAPSIGLSEYKTTYGEATEAGIYAISEKLRHYTKGSGTGAAKPGGVFYDLGSGLGKVVVGMAVLNPELRCVGVEIVPERVRIANSTLEKIRQRQIRSRIVFHHGDFLSGDLNFRDAICIFVSNLCFTETTNCQIAQKILREATPGCLVIVSREIPLPAERCQRLERDCVIPMTWSASSTCFVYRIR